MLTRFLRSSVRRGLQRLGYHVIQYDPQKDFEDADLREEDEATGIIKAVGPYTMTSRASVSAMCAAVRHVHTAGVDGAVLECGVWRGGMMMAAALELLRLGVTDRELILCDTFDGLPAPGVHDIARRGVPAGEALSVNTDDQGKACRAGLETVQQNMRSTQYPVERVRYVPGLVEQTLPEHAPDRIAVLRLDTDFYESTRHELEHLYPRLSVGGVLIIDDYGYWQGARKAVDEFVGATEPGLLLCRIDHSARIAVKWR